MAVIVETLIRLLDDTGNDLRRGRYPKDDKARKVAQVLRAVADDLDV
jgi:CspA family cold shock protein